VPASGNEFAASRRFAAIELASTDSHFGDKPTDTLLLDLTNGARRTVPGWQPICWNPDGTKLLVRRTKSATDSELALLDPKHPEAPPAPLGTIPHLMIYRGAWVARH